MAEVAYTGRTLSLCASELRQAAGPRVAVYRQPAFCRHSLRVPPLPVQACRINESVQVAKVEAKGSAECPIERVHPAREEASR